MAFNNDKPHMMQSLSGWWLSHNSEKYEFVSWDDDIPNLWKNIIFPQTDLK
jgi:hypothetical protein